MTAQEFQEATGHEPMDDDLERVNCPDAGRIGHVTCGWCAKHQRPVAWCLTKKCRKQAQSQAGGR